VSCVTLSFLLPESFRSRFVRISPSSPTLLTLPRMSCASLHSQHDYFVKRILHPSPRLLAQDSKPCHAQTHIHVPLPLALHPESPPHTHTAICPAWCAVLPTCHNHKHDRMIIFRELISSRCRVPYRIYRIRHLQWRQDKWSSDAVLSRISNPESIATLHFRRERE
jgi:hypothetical protein